jgi:glycerate dehydrogenase
MLELANHVGEHASSVREGDWARSPDWTYWKSPLIELDGLTLGILGFGRIGQRVAELGHALGMKVIYSARSPGRVVLFPAQRVSQEELFSRSDFLSLHCGLTDDTREVVNQRLLQRMKPSAFLINTARGQLIRERDLAGALHSGTLAGAALDVLSSEPPTPDNPLMHAPNCLITPHIAWGSLAARKRILATTIENVKSFIAGAPINVVNA